jgi:hypothetical protein
MADHPGAIFKDGPTGRCAALAYGPDVWEVIKVLREVDERGAKALEAAAEVFALDVNRIATAANYYGDFQAEIDAEIAAADEPSIRAEQMWILCGWTVLRFTADEMLRHPDRVVAQSSSGGRRLQDHGSGSAVIRRE